MIINGVDLEKYWEELNKTREGKLLRLASTMLAFKMDMNALPIKGLAFIMSMELTPQNILEVKTAGQIWEELP